TPPAIADAIAHKRLFGNRALEESFGSKAGLFEVCRLQHDADTSSVIFKGDDPEPTIQRAHHPRECPIDSSLTFHTLVVRKKRELLQMRIIFLQLEFVSDDRIAPAGVD